MAEVFDKMESVEEGLRVKQLWWNKGNPKKIDIHEFPSQKFKGKILIPKIDNECQKDKLEEEVAMVKELQNIVYHL